MNKYPIGGFAPGNYMNNCLTCDSKFIGDKGAWQCEPCATEFNIRQLSGTTEKITPVLDGAETIDGQPIDKYLDELGQ